MCIDIHLMSFHVPKKHKRTHTHKRKYNTATLDHNSKKRGGGEVKQNLYKYKFDKNGEFGGQWI